MASNEPSAEPDTVPQTPQTPQTRRPRRYSLTRVHTGTYPDAASVYHPEGEREEYAKSSSSESAEDEEVIENKDVEELLEVRGGIPDERDVEKGDTQLEKKKTSKSAKSARSVRDPNEVRPSIAPCNNIVSHLTSFPGGMGRTRRPSQPQELDQAPKMDCHVRRLLLHAPLPSVLHHGLALSTDHLQRIQHHQRG